MEFTEQWLLRVTDLKQYDYCPRVVYYEHCLPKLRPVTYKMTAGIAAQERVTALEERRSLRTYGLTSGERHFNVAVSSAQLGFTGQIDCLALGRSMAGAGGAGDALLYPHQTGRSRTDHGPAAPHHPAPPGRDATDDRPPGHAGAHTAPRPLREL